MLSDTSPLHVDAYRSEVRRQAALARPHVHSLQSQRLWLMPVSTARRSIGQRLAHMGQRLVRAQAADSIQHETAELG